MRNNNKANLIYNNFSHLTYGYIDCDGFLKGRSVLLSMSLNGDIETEHENVVIDFGLGRDLVDKDIIHGKLGLDHKLWIYKDNNIELSGPYTIWNDVTHEDQEHIDITTKYMKITIPYEACVFVDSNLGEVDFINRFVNKRTKEILGDKRNFYVQIFDVSETPLLHNIYNSDKIVKFNYTHSLKNSSHFGCRSVHGHSSVVAFRNPISKDVDNELYDVIRDVIYNKWHNLTYIWFNNYKVHDLADDPRSFAEYDYTNGYQYTDIGGRTVSIQYTKYAKLSNKRSIYKVLDNETTCEYLSKSIGMDIANELLNRYGDTCKSDFGNYSIYISEGLQKGCEVYLGDYFSSDE